MKNDIKARIINGKSAESPIPWQVHVHSFKGVCGGTILDEETILSAAHCFEGEMKFNFCKIYILEISWVLMKQNFVNIYIITNHVDSFNDLK